MKFFLALPLLFSHTSWADSVASHATSVISDSFDSEGLWILGIGGLATVVAHQFDGSTRDGAKNHQYMDTSVTKIGEFWGSGLPEISILALQYHYDEANAVPAAEGFLLGSLVVEGLKYSIQRERPNGQGNVSMPSGHTQASFSIAMSMTQAYELKKTWPLWTMAFFTGLTRISDDQHWLSDVTAGATLGILFGRAGFLHHRHLMAMPSLRNSALDGLQVSYEIFF